MVLSLNILWNEVHRSRTVQRDTGDNVFQILWFQFLHEPFHTATFQLEYTICLAASNVIQYFFIVIINRIDVNLFAGTLFCQAHCILNNSQRPETEEIHFQKSQLFQRCHCKLCDNRTIRTYRKRHVFFYCFLTDHNAGCMHGCMSRKSFQTHGHIDQLFYLRIVIVSFFEIRTGL